jgi:hypothetical protein
MTEKNNQSLDILENLRAVERPLYLARELVEYFSAEFCEEEIYDSEETRRELRTIRKSLIKDLNKLRGILGDIDPELVCFWEWDSDSLVFDGLEDDVG